MMQRNQSDRTRLEVIDDSRATTALIRQLFDRLADNDIELHYLNGSEQTQSPASWRLDPSAQRPVDDKNSITILINGTSILKGFRTILPALATTPPLLTVDLFSGNSLRISATIALVADSLTESLELTQRFVADGVKSLLEGATTAPGISTALAGSRPRQCAGPLAGVWGLLVSSKERVKRYLVWKLCRERWHIAVADHTDGFDPMSLAKQQWRPVTLAAKHCADYHADPFLLSATISNDSAITEWLLFEHFDHNADKGEIRAVALPEQEPGAYCSLLSLSGHLSYPHVFQLGNQSYLLPEQVGTGLPPQAYTLDSKQQPGITGDPIPMPGLPPLFDGTMFKYGDHYWLLGTLKKFSNSSHLGLWFADHPFAGWQPHRYMPVAINSQYGRPAGTPFHHQNRLIIPLQNSARGYGKRIELFEVVKLSPTDLDWQHCGTISKEMINLPGARIGGVHTLSVSNHSLAIDYLTISLKR